MPTEAKLFKIKPVKWKQFSTDSSYGARTPFGFARIYWPFGGSGLVLRFDWDRDASYPCASPEAGKQLAEAHWQQYIKQALIEVEQ